MSNEPGQMPVSAEEQDSAGEKPADAPLPNGVGETAPGTQAPDELPTGLTSAIPGEEPARPVEQPLAGEDEITRGGPGTRRPAARTHRVRRTPAREFHPPGDDTASRGASTAETHRAVAGGQATTPKGPDYDLDGRPDQRWDSSARERAGASGAQAPPSRPSTVTGGGRLSVVDLERLEEVRSHSHPGDRYVRRVRPTSKGFRRLGPGHLEALPQALQPSSRAGRVASRLKKVVIGTPISTAAAAHERLTKSKALAVLSSDALSSVTYATEAILATIVVAGYGAFQYGIPLAVAIALLIGIVVFSYRQTIHAYPRGGGTYIVSKDNLGTLAGLVGGGSLLVGYTLTVAVSIAAGVANLISLGSNLGGFRLDEHRVEIALVSVLVLVLLNLRGIRESATIFAAPTYIFLILMFGMLGLGIYQYFTGTLAPVGEVPDALEAPEGLLLNQLTLLLFLRAFASGCAALTGIEAISDGVAAFEKPEARNAATTLTTLGVLLATMFLGISFLAEHARVRISETETVVSQLGRAIFGTGPVYSLFLIFTALLLVLAANTAFADFPRLGYFLARDRFLPNQFTFRGDRLAFSFGIITLGVVAGILIIIFRGDIEGLLPLYAIGVFTGFTLSQSGMVKRWWRLRPPGWQLSLGINALGALTTGLVTVILAITKSAEGAWIVLVVVPLLVLLFLRINRHYTHLRKQVSLEAVDPDIARIAAAGAVLPSAPEATLPNVSTAAGIRPRPGEVGRPMEHLVIIPVADLNQLTLRTLTYARSLTQNVVGVHVASDEEPEELEELERRWHEWLPDVPLVVVDSPYRSLIRPLLAYIDALHSQAPNRTLTVMLPEFVARRWWEHLLHNQTALRLKGALLFRPGIVVTSVPYHLDA